MREIGGEVIVGHDARRLPRSERGEGIAPRRWDIEHDGAIPQHDMGHRALQGLVAPKGRSVQ